MANWRFYRETVHFFGPKWSYWRFTIKRKIRRDFRGVLDAQGTFLLLVLMPPKGGFSIGIHSINRASEWLEIQETLKMAKMCTVFRLERQFATLYLFHAPTSIGFRCFSPQGTKQREDRQASLCRTS